MTIDEAAKVLNEHTYRGRSNWVHMEIFAISKDKDGEEILTHFEAVALAQAYQRLDAEGDDYERRGQT
ncbi:MAG TPA: hypothetical protein VN647_08970 [Nitrospira sp.]|nr:hypothetical protein [Nitrospira sp.]